MGKECLFQFPRPLSSETLILTDDEAERAHRSYFEREAGNEFAINYNPDLMAS